MNLTDKIIEYLKENQIPYKEVDHPPAKTCQESAIFRGKEQRIGGKSILFKDQNGFSLFVISAQKQIDSNKVRKILKSQKLRFATSQELFDLTGVEKGALPPFGPPILPFQLYLDNSILENDLMAFNAGITTKSIIINLKDYLKLIDPVNCSFAQKDNS